MPSGAHADGPAVGIRQTDGRDHVLFTRGLDDDVGVAIWQTDVPASSATRGLIAWIGTPEGLADEISCLPHAISAPHAAERRAHKCSDAMRAPSTRVRSFAHMIEG